MNSPNRINSVSVAPTMSQQTPRNSFGERFSQASSEVVRVGGALASGVTVGSPALSAAVAGVTSAVASGIVSTPNSNSHVQIPAERSDSLDLLKLQDHQSRQYLQLQMQMQQESREFNTVTNILKVRHDSAKAAINNVR